MDKAIWLAQVEEETLEPAMPVCDPHHHLWDHTGSRYLMEELLQDTGSGHRVVSTVFVECSSMYREQGEESLKPVGETEFVQAIADQSAKGDYDFTKTDFTKTDSTKTDSTQAGATKVALGIVGYADLTLGLAVKEVLEAHTYASPDRFRGIRHASGWHESNDIRNSHTNPVNHLMMDDKFREGLRVLGEMDLSFDSWFYHHQIDEFVDLACCAPEVTIILDHFGGPLGIGPYKGRQQDVFSEWREKITALEDCQNVFFKLGGINMKINGFDWHHREMPPTSDELVDKTAAYYEHCIDTFGADRCMFESNFPVDKDSCSYNILWNTFKKIAASRTADEKAALFHDTAARAYRL